MYLLPKNTKQTKLTKPTHTRPCFVCDKEFLPVRHNVVTCGPECSVKQKNNRRRKLETEGVAWKISYYHIQKERDSLKEENKQLKAQLGIKE
jgi:predicted nucleic acid-binding Zn ribbon protein